MSPSVDLNADLGEGMAGDAALMQVVTSCNIACGGHAGDAASMRAALMAAKTHGVSAGAHPSYPDREGFGRRSLDISASALAADLTEQISALQAAADDIGVALTHMKPHGALYNDAVRDRELAGLIVRVFQASMAGAYLVGPPRSALETAATEAGLYYVCEGFADRAYTAEGALVSRDVPGAVIDDETLRVRQALQLAHGEPIKSHSGDALSLSVQTICVHGDTPGALASAKAIRAALEADGFTLRPPA